jgi:hypothetical protein
MSRPYVARRHKYRAVPTTVDGIRFASKKEAQRWVELRLLEKAGEIWDLERQPRFPLLVPSTWWHLGRALKRRPVKIGEYRGDFKYHDRRSTPYTVEDVKGFKTALYRWKKKHVEAQYGITITEV